MYVYVDGPTESTLRVVPKAAKKNGATVAVWSPMMGGSEASMQ